MIKQCLTFLRRILAVRARYVFTRGGALRVRYIAVVAVLLLMTPLLWGESFTSAFTAFSKSGHAHLHNAEFHSAKAQTQEIQSPLSTGIRKAAVAMQKPTLPLYKELKINAGETLAGALQGQGVGGKDTYFALDALSKHYDVRKVRPGQSLDVYFKRAADGEGRVFDRIAMKLDPVRDVTVSKTGENQFKADLKEKELVRRTYARSAMINGSLYGAAASNDIPDKIIANMSKLYANSMNLKRDIKRNDRIEVMYDAMETEDGSYSRTGKILYANVVLGKSENPIYYFKASSGNENYFRKNGYTLKQGLMRNLVKGARMSSGYGMRKHPILGYKKMHAGIDFAARTGTPIYAAANGRISYIGRKGGYGKYISIKHNSSLETAYAHMSKFKSGLKQGSRVKQGDVIGYVGSTGRSTGPHLHYEVKVNGKRVNPRSKKLPTGEQLTGSDMARFKTAMANTKRQYASISGAVKLAGNIPRKPTNVQ